MAHEIPLSEYRLLAIAVLYEALADSIRPPLKNQQPGITAAYEADRKSAIRFLEGGEALDFWSQLAEVSVWLVHRKADAIADGRETLPRSIIIKRLFDEALVEWNS